MNKNMVAIISVFAFLSLAVMAFFILVYVPYEEEVVPDHEVYRMAMENNQTVAEFCDGEDPDLIGDCLDYGFEYYCEDLSDVSSSRFSGATISDVCHFLKAVHLNSSSSYDECSKISDTTSAKDCELASTPGGCFVTNETYGELTAYFNQNMLNTTIESVDDSVREAFSIIDVCRNLPSLMVDPESLELYLDSEGIDEDDLTQDDVDQISMIEVDLYDRNDIIDEMSQLINPNHFCLDIENFDECMKISRDSYFDFTDCSYFERYGQNYADKCNFVKGISHGFNSDACYDIDEYVARNACSAIAERGCLFVTEETSEYEGWINPFYGEEYFERYEPCI